jgi:hypothetical protein
MKTPTHMPRPARTLRQFKLMALLRRTPPAKVPRQITVPASRPSPKGEEPARLVA